MTRLSCLLVFTLLAGCASRQPPEPMLDKVPAHCQWEAHKAEIGQLRDWSLQGRIAVSVDKDAWSAGLRWFQRDMRYTIDLTAPLGQGAYSLRGVDGRVTLRTADNKRVVSNSPETLMQTHLGWSLPVSGLNYWLRGIPVPNAPVERLQLNDAGQMLALDQSGWRIHVKRYGISNGLVLPTKIFLDSERINVRLAVRQWQITP